MDRHPDGLPELFLDRSLGRRQGPDLLRTAGLRLQTLSEVYGVPADEDVADVDWLELAGTRGWVVLMKDERIRYRTAERRALIDHDVMAFCLTSGNLRARQMAELSLSSIEEITAACRNRGPFVYAVSPAVSDSWTLRSTRPGHRRGYSTRLHTTSIAAGARRTARPGREGRCACQELHPRW